VLFCALTHKKDLTSLSISHILFAISYLSTRTFFKAPFGVFNPN
jgi:hypothetical protein